MFGKKKKGESPPPEPPPVEDNAKGKKGKASNKKSDAKDAVGVQEPLPQTSGKRKFKFLSKKVLFVLLGLLSVGIAGFVVYKLYFSKKDGAEVKRVYVQKELKNVILAEEVIRFSFNLLPEFYEYTLIFNDQIVTLEDEVNRLKALGEQFPDQIKIAEKEINLLEKEKNKLKQSYEKLEKKVEALYVSYRVNQEAGLQQIEEQKNEIFTTAKEAITPLLEITDRIKLFTQEKIPEGFIKGTTYKIRKKIDSFMKKD
ncbi:MAG: hypothetical protein HQK71_08410 [Desulfamplus sp.]|nr:hypothetical protein [Desulfamplus sp.]